MQVTVESWMRLELSVGSRRRFSFAMVLLMTSTIAFCLRVASGTSDIAVLVGSCFVAVLRVPAACAWFVRRIGECIFGLLAVFIQHLRFGLSSCRGCIRVVLDFEAWRIVPQRRAGGAPAELCLAAQPTAGIGVNSQVRLPFSSYWQWRWFGIVRS